MRRKKGVIAAVSGGADSVYLIENILKEIGGVARVKVVHINHASRGVESAKDEQFVRKLCENKRVPINIFKAAVPGGIPLRRQMTGGFEVRARSLRQEVFSTIRGIDPGARIAVGHTADDQVETILMRFFEGGGIAGLKGIPRETKEGIIRPILHVWKKDILEYLKRHNISYRVDESNFDTRFERNWIRHVLIPLVEERYGKGVKKRIYTLGERFRELDDFIETEAVKWIRRNVKSRQQLKVGEKNVLEVPSITEKSPHRTRPADKAGVSGRMTGGPGNGEGKIHFPRKGFLRLPTVLRVKILQRLCFDHLGIVPNERLLIAMDKNVCAGGPSGKVKAGKGWELVNRYEQAAFVRSVTGRKGANRETVLVMEEKEKITPAQARRAALSGGKEYFDAAGIRTPLSVRPLRAGDRIRPFGLDSEKKVKEILIDRKVHRDERWGRPVVCDAGGRILWIPGVVRSAHAPVGPKTKKALLLKIDRK